MYFDKQSALSNLFFCHYYIFDYSIDTKGIHLKQACVYQKSNVIKKCHIILNPWNYSPVSSSETQTDYGVSIIILL